MSQTDKDITGLSSAVSFNDTAPKRDALGEFSSAFMHPEDVERNDAVVNWLNPGTGMSAK